MIYAAMYVAVCEKSRTQEDGRKCDAELDYRSMFLVGSQWSLIYVGYMLIWINVVNNFNIISSRDSNFT